MLKPFSVLVSIDIVVSVKSLPTEVMMSIDAKMPNGLNLRLFWSR